MCVACHESLAVAQSPEAYPSASTCATSSRQGLTGKPDRVRDGRSYGPAVLALAAQHGFNLLVYIIPPAVVLAGHRHAGAHAPPLAAPGAGPRPTEPAGPTVRSIQRDAQRLDEELAGRFA